MAIITFSVNATDTKIWLFPNNTGYLVRSIHILLTGTGGNYSYQYPTIDPPVNVSGDLLDLDFFPGIPDGSKVAIKFTTNAGPLAVDSWHWADLLHNQIGPSYGMGNLSLMPESNRGVNSIHFADAGGGNYNIIADICVENASWDQKDLSCLVIFKINNIPVHSDLVPFVVYAGGSDCGFHQREYPAGSGKIQEYCGGSCPPSHGLPGSVTSCDETFAIHYCHCVEYLRGSMNDVHLVPGDVVCVQVGPAPGAVFDLFTGDDQFVVTFPTNMIPTLTQWGLIILGIGLCVLGTVYLLRHRHAVCQV